MGQLGFFDLRRRYEGLDAKDDPLVASAAMVPWESFRVRTIGIVRARCKIGTTNLVSNMRRFVCLERMAEVAR